MKRPGEEDQMAPDRDLKPGSDLKPASPLQRKRREVYEQPYGHLGELNTCRVLLDSVGEDLPLIL